MGLKETLTTGDSVRQVDRTLAAIAPGTPMHKAIPPRLVEPYLTGRRSIISGYVYLAADSSFLYPAEFYDACGLGYEGSDFTPDMDQLYLLRWRTVGTEPLQVAGQAASMQWAAAPAAWGAPAHVLAITEFYTEPVPVPVGTEIFRIQSGQADFIARYDGQVWLSPAEGI
ncbi:MAG: hypothetical protein ACLPN6_05220 [Streptosporangiaceae bacterium]